jgi:hypothetical protein
MKVYLIWFENQREHWAEPKTEGYVVKFEGQVSRIWASMDREVAVRAMHDFRCKNPGVSYRLHSLDVTVDIV